MTNSTRQAAIVSVCAGLVFCARAQEPAAAPVAPAVPDPAAQSVPTNAPAVHAPAVKAKKKGGTPSLFSGSSTNAIGGMTITSDRMEFDYKEFVIAFDERVHVTDPQFALTADRVIVFLEGTNQMKRIWAIGHVEITQADRRATCGRAVYERATGQVVMTESPVVTRGADRFTGSELIVWVNDQRVVGKDVRVLISPETMKKRELQP